MRPSVDASRRLSIISHSSLHCCAANQWDDYTRGALRAWRARLGFDYGKFDFVVRDGEPVLFDVNRTPTMASNLSAALEAGMGELARGMAAFVSA